MSSTTTTTPAIPPPGGIYVPVPTFFLPSSSSSSSSSPLLDLPAQIAHSVHLARSGIRGLVLLGSTGEAVHLTRSERISQIVAVRGGLEDAGFKRYPLIVGTATNSIDETVELLKDAGEAGAQWGLVLAPGYFAGVVGEEGLVGWFGAVADRSVIPVLLYHYPAVSNNLKFPPSTFRTLSTHKNIVGCKLSHGDISTHTQIALDPITDHTHFQVFTGLGQQLVAALQLGCCGAIDGLAGIFPKTLVRLYNLSIAPDASTASSREEARRIQYVVCCAEELVGRWGAVGIKEGVKRVLGIGKEGGGRFPLRSGLAEEEWERWRGVVEEMKRVEDSL